MSDVHYKDYVMKSMYKYVDMWRHNHTITLSVEIML